MSVLGPANIKEGPAITSKIDWKVRFRNPAFWVSIAISFFVPIFTHFGYSWSQMTSWPRLFDLIGDAFANPVVVVAIFVSVWNSVLDPTTKGFSDCKVKLGQMSAAATDTRTESA